MAQFITTPAGKETASVWRRREPSYVRVTAARAAAPFKDAQDRPSKTSSQRKTVGELETQQDAPAEKPGADVNVTATSKRAEFVALGTENVITR